VVEATSLPLTDPLRFRHRYSKSSALTGVPSDQAAFCLILETIVCGSSLVWVAESIRSLLSWTE
jgi:hypothetical protein